jgi:flavin reductase (DIM6/NTAB) family NADH-FMN oxidoreductase RutF
MPFVHFDLEHPRDDPSVTRWVQPPQITYFVTTIDKQGNMNTTPVSMGTCVGPPQHFAFSLSNFVPDFWKSDRQDLKDAYLNLKENPECVISYVGSPLLRESWVTALPVPRGISEIDVAGLTPMPSQKVAPCGIQECPVNLEARVIETYTMPPYHTLYICDIVSVSVDTGYVVRDQEIWHGTGVLAIDPLFEVLIAGGDTGNARLYYGRIDPKTVERTPDDIGCLGNVWIGTFDQWMADEETRGKINAEERADILALRDEWEANPDPEENAKTRARLTAWLQKITES